MLNLKKMVSALLGVTMVSNMALSMPAFAEETIERTYVYDGYEVAYDVTNSWGDTETISITLSNTGDETIENWMLAYEGFTGTIDGIWDATVVETDSGDSYIRNAGYNANIAPDTSVSFGYNLTNAESFPEMIVMSQERVTKSNEDFSVSLNVLDDWGSAFNAEIVLRNNMDKSLEWWELEFGSNFTITEITTSWAAEKFDLGDASYMFKGTYTGIVPPQSTVSLGFSGVKNENLDDPMITVNGLTEVVFGGFPDNVDVEFARQAELEYVESLNENAKYPVEIEYNDDGTVNSIDGKFSDVAVVDAESALLALNDVKNLLGISDPNTQLVLDYVYTSETAGFKSYFFKEVYKDTVVYDRTVTIVVCDNGETLSLESNFIAINDLCVTPQLPIEIIEETYNVEGAELLIYTFDDYKEHPILVYNCLTESEFLIVSATSGEIIMRWDTEIYDVMDEVVFEEDIYNMPEASKKYDNNDDLIYVKGRFGTVDASQEDSPMLILNSAERDELKVNDGFVEFSFAAKGNTFIPQTIPKEEYSEFIQEHTCVIAKTYDNDYLIDVAVDEYHFDQIYNGVKVYGRVITLTVNDEGNTIIMDSNIMSATELSDAFSKVSVQENASVEEIRTINSKLASLDVELTEPVLYTWNEYSEDPVLVYIFLDRDNNRTYLVSAESDDYGQILNETDDSYQLGKGLDEGAEKICRRLQYFPILNDGSMGVSKSYETHNGQMVVYYPSRSIVGSDYVRSTPVQSLTTYFYEPEAVSAYMNCLTVYSFYANELNHYLHDNNRNGKESLLKIYIKQKSMPGAYASAGSGYINLPLRGLAMRSNGADRLTTVGHEYTHTIFHAFNGGLPVQNTVTRGLNEGYAYLFGYNILSEWKITTRTWMPTFSVDFESSRLEYLVENGDTTKDGHSMTPFVTYPAKLMLDGGLTKSEIAQLYYNSLVMGRYNYNSTLNSVRVNVIKAAKALGLDDDKLTIVREALDEVWEKDNRVYDFTLNVEEYLNPDAEVEDVTVTLRKSLNESPLESKESGSFVYTVEPGNIYYLEVSAPGYVTYRNRVHMYYMENNSHTVQLVKLNYDSDNNVINGTTLLKAVDCITNLPVGAIVKFRTYDESFNMVYLTDDTGTAISYLADSTTGYTEAISMVPGYYYPYVSEADNYFVKPMMTVASNNATPDESNAYIYYDSNMDGTAQSHFFRVLVNEYQEKETEFNAFDTLTVIAEADTYVGRSGPTQFGRELYLLCYEPDTETSFDIVFRPNEAQLELLEAILVSEGNLYTDPTTGEKMLGHLEKGELVAEPSSKSYYNIEIASNNIGVTNPTIITAWELYEGLMNNDGVYSLSKITFDGEGSYSTQ